MLCSADWARRRCALDGGLKEESRIRSVFGLGGGMLVKGLTVWRTRKRELEDWNAWRPELRAGGIERSVLRGIDISVGADAIVRARSTTLGLVLKKDGGSDCLPMTNRHGL